MSETSRGQTEPLSLDTINDYLDSGFPATILLGATGAHILRIDPSHREFTVTSPADGSFEDSGKLKNLTVELDETSDPPSYVLTMKVGDYPDAAASLAQAVVRSLDSGTSYATALDRALEDFRDLLRRKGRMSESQETGLHGELLVLEHLIGTIGAAKAVDAWVGPASEEHDFVLAGYDLEIKTTMSETRKHMIHGPGQLLPRIDVPLWLVSIQLTRAGGSPGRNLTDLARAVLSRLGPRAPRVREELDRIGWREDDADLYSTPRVLRSLPRCCAVDSQFPAITPAVLSEGVANSSLISDLRYTVDVSALPYGVPGDEMRGFAEEP